MIACRIFVLTVLIFVGSWIATCAAVAAVKYTNGHPHLIQQGRDEDGSIFLFSPYFLWNDDLHNNASELTAPLELRSVNGRLDVTLTVEQAQVENEVFTLSSRLFCVGSVCRSPGPTLYVHPGDLLRITLINNLLNSSGLATTGPNNGSRLYPNRTNIFIQGLPLDPSLNNPYRYTWGGGDRQLYEYIVPEDTAVGVKWYHSRVHGISAMQVMGGLFGALVVEYPPSKVLLPDTLAAIDRQLLVLSHIMATKSSLQLEGVRNEGYSLVDEGYKNSSLSFEYLSNASGSTLPMNLTLHVDELQTDVWLTNGQYQPTYTMQPGEWRIFDLLVASGDRIVELELRTDIGYAAGLSAVDAAKCDIRLLALDGIYLSESRTGPAVTHLTLLQSSRASIAVMCSEVDTYYFQSATTFDRSNEHFGIGDFQTKSNQNLLTLNIAGAEFIMDAPPTNLSSIPRPAAFDDLLTTSTSSAASIETETWSISTAQGGCCGVTTVGLSVDQLCALDAAAAGRTTSPSFWLGVGADCRPACYEPILCAALYGIDPSGAIAAVSVDQGGGGYSLESFPTSRKGACQYASFPGYLQYNYSASGAEAASGGCSTSYTRTVADAATVASARNVGQSSAVSSTVLTAGFVATQGARQVISLYGHEDFPYPLFLQGHAFQIGEFSNVDKSISNIIGRSEYAVTGSIDSSLYAATGDWKEVWPSLTGKSVLFANIADVSNASLLILTPFLKYSDAGLIRNIAVQSASDAANDTATGGSSEDTAAADVVDDTVMVIDIPRSAELNSDSAAAQYLCDVDGANFSYTEAMAVQQRIRTLSFNSCPNHFSLCQDNECGGEQKTRALIRPDTLQVPLYPGIAARGPLDTTCSADLVGVALNGVGIYSASDGSTDVCSADTTGNYTAAVYGRTACKIPGRYDGIRCER